MEEPPITPAPMDKTLAILIENQRRFIAFLAPRVRRVEDADEILQDAFAKSVAARDNVAEESAVAWFYTVLRNALVDYYRRHDIESRALTQIQTEAAHRGEEWTQELQNTVCACVSDLIPTLRPEYADLIRRVDLGGASVKAAASELGITANNAGVRLHRARMALKEGLEQTCQACAAHGCLDCSCREKT